MAWAMHALTGDPVFRLKRYDFAAGAWRRLDVTVRSEDAGSRKVLGFRPSDEAYDSESTFMLVRGYVQRKALIGASFASSSSTDALAGGGGAGALGPNGERFGPCGLVSGHAYCVLSVGLFKLRDGSYLRLVKLRNPWGQPEWQGAWGRGSEQWVRHAWLLRYTKPKGEEAPGTFWMEWSDFSAIFDKIDICSAVVRPSNTFPRLLRTDFELAEMEGI